MKHGILFDVDGVIADSEAVNVAATQKAFAERLGIDNVKTEDFHAGIGRGAEAYVRAGAVVHGRELTDAEVTVVVQARQDNFLSILDSSPLLPYPGVLELMQAALDHPDFSVAIATSSTRQKSQAVLDATGVPYHDMVYICGDQVTHKKPHPEVFLLACQSLNLPPAQCVVIEDAPNGIQAAKAAGCTCVAVTNTHPADQLRNADLVVASLADVKTPELPFSTPKWP